MHQRNFSLHFLWSFSYQSLTHTSLLWRNRVITIQYCTVTYCNLAFSIIARAISPTSLELKKCDLFEFLFRKNISLKASKFRNVATRSFKDGSARQKFLRKSVLFWFVFWTSKKWIESINENEKKLWNHNHT